jgi:UDPglucose--hexose-1-phosphate uridylyltransferase
MPELRTDWLTGRTVIIAANRADRPNEFAEPTSAGEAASAAGRNTAMPFACPFCAGHESKTPPSVYETKGANGRWQIRVVPNKYPALAVDERPSAEGTAVGAHEVIIESPRHIDRVSDLSVEQLRDVLAAYAQRLVHWRADGRFRYGLVFKNQGQQAGASLAHLHSQFVALPDVPPTVLAEFERAQREFAEHDRCAYCRLLERERAASERIVLDRDGFVAFCPFASLQPLEVWLMPVAHEPWFERPCQADSWARLADVLLELVQRLEPMLPGAAYNLLLRTAPWIAGGAHSAHWRIEFLPRLAALAGLELATGVHINPVPPELAAHRLAAR